MKKNILILLLNLIALNLHSQLKVGTNTKNISKNSNLEVESSLGRTFIITRDSSKVGIGTISPSHLLHIIDSVNNPVRIVGLKSGKSTDSLLTVDSLGVVKRLSSLSLGSLTEPWFNVATNTAATSNTQNIYQMGKVGISTSNPQLNLDVAPVSGGAGINIGTTGTASSDQAYITLGSKYDRVSPITSASNLCWQIGARGDAWASTNKNTFHLSYWNGTSWKENMTIQPSGNVGIGVTNPTWLLDVRKASANSELMAHFVNPGGQATSESQVAIGAGPGTWAKLVGYNGTLGFRNYTTNTEFMTMKTGTGFVGIGTTNPLHELHIANTGPNITPWDKSLLHLQNGDIHYTISLANNFNNANWGSGAADYLANGVNNAMVINLGGMGQYIFGDHVGPWSTGAYDLGHSYARWNNIYLTNSPNVSSDLRLKSEIKPLDLGLKEILKLKPKMYKKHNDFDKKSEGKKEYGFIAQELKEVLPIVVTGNEHDGNPLGVMYEQVIPVMTQAIKELKNEVDKIENINQELKEKLNQKNIEISKLKEMIFELREEFQTFKSASK